MTTTAQLISIQNPPLLLGTNTKFQFSSMSSEPQKSKPAIGPQACGKGRGAGSISDGVRQKLLNYLMNKKRPSSDHQALLRSTSVTCNGCPASSDNLLGNRDFGQSEAGARKADSRISHSCNPLPHVRTLKRCHSIRNLPHRSHPYHHHSSENQRISEKYINYNYNDRDKGNQSLDFQRGSKMGARQVSQPLMGPGQSLDPPAPPMRKTYSESDLKYKRGLSGLKMSTRPTQLKSPDQAMDLSFHPAKGGTAGKKPRGIDFNNDKTEHRLTETSELGSKQTGLVWQSLPNIPKGVGGRAGNYAAMDIDGNQRACKSLKIKHHPYSIDCLVYNGQSTSSRSQPRNVPSTSPIQESMNVTPPPTLSCSQPQNTFAPTLFPPPHQSPNFYLGPAPAYNYFHTAAAYMMYCCSLQAYPYLNLQQQQPGPFYPPAPPLYPQTPFSALSSTQEPAFSSTREEPRHSNHLSVRSSPSHNKRWSDGGEIGKDLVMDHESAHPDEPFVFRNRGASTGARVPYKPRYHRMFALKAEAEAAKTPFERTNSEPIPPPNHVFNADPCLPLKPQHSFPVKGKISKCGGRHRQPMSKPLKKCVSDWKLTPVQESASKSTSNVFDYNEEPNDVVGEDKAGDKQRLKEAILQWVANKSLSTTSNDLNSIKPSPARVPIASKRLKRAKNVDIPEDQTLPNHTPSTQNNNYCHQNDMQTGKQYFNSRAGLCQIVHTIEGSKTTSAPNGLTLSQRREDVNQRISLLLSKGLGASSISMEQRATNRMISEIEAINALASLSMTQSR